MEIEGDIFLYHCTNDHLFYCVVYMFFSLQTPPVERPKDLDAQENHIERTLRK